MKASILKRIHASLERRLPEQRLFLRSDSETRFIRLRTETQAVAIFGSTVFVAWTIIASAILIMDNVGASSLRDQARRENSIYEQRLNALAAERDAMAAEARAARERFELAMSEVSQMQSQLLASEERRRELETGLRVVQRTLRDTMNDRDAALTKVAKLTGAQAENEAAQSSGTQLVEDMKQTLAFLSNALKQTGAERDAIAADAAAARDMAQALDYDLQLMKDRNDHIFGQIEDAMAVSVEPLNKMFKSAGLNPETLIDQVRRGYSGQGGPLTPISFSTKGVPPSADSLRANEILNRLDRLNLYRIAAEKVPFSEPLNASYRFTSPFGQRWGRMHEGIDVASAYGTPILATADGVVTHAGWSSGYGRLVKIRHDFGIETRYAHMSKLRVKVGQRVSRGDRIGDMGNSGRSTGTHLHYEVRVSDKPVNPMTYIKAARDVF